MHRRPELYDVYLVELLTLFADKGVAIQNVSISHTHVNVSETFHFSIDGTYMLVDGGYDRTARISPPSHRCPPYTTRFQSPIITRVPSGTSVPQYVVFVCAVQFFLG